MVIDSPYIDRLSWRGMYGPMAKDIIETDDFAVWSIKNKRKGVLFSNNISSLEEIIPCKLFYISKTQLNLIPYNKKLEKLISFCYDLKIFTQTYNKHRGIRGRINKNIKRKFIIKSNFNNIKEIEKFIIEWRGNYSDKYIFDYSGRNRMFYERNYHIDCYNFFIYDKDRLIAIGTASNGSYIIGKAFYHEYDGLSEYLDYTVFSSLYNKGIKYINSGCASKGLRNYKEKLPGCYKKEEYNVNLF